MSKLYLGVDPGSANYAYTYLEVSPVKIISCGMIQTTINNLIDKPVKPPKSQIRKTKSFVYRKPFMDQLGLYCKDWKKSFNKFKPYHITCERYQSRRMGGAVIEYTNMMSGVLACLTRDHGHTIDFITAATWKNQINKLSCLDDIYKEVSLPPHVVDSAFIGLFGALKKTGTPWTNKYVDLLYNQLTELELS